MLRADAVVVGSVNLGACLDGCLGTVDVQERLRGDVAGRRRFITEGPSVFPAQGETRIVFLAREPPELRSLLTSDGTVGLPLERRAEVLATRAPRAIVASELQPFTGRLATLRAHNQTTRGPSAQGIVAIAREVFSQLDFRGLSAARLVALLGEPQRRERADGRESFHYAFHDGEQGLLPQLILEHGVVTAVLPMGGR